MYIDIGNRNGTCLPKISGKMRSFSVAFAYEYVALVYFNLIHFPILEVHVSVFMRYLCRVGISCIQYMPSAMNTYHYAYDRYLLIKKQRYYVQQRKVSKIKF